MYLHVLQFVILSTMTLRFAGFSSSGFWQIILARVRCIMLSNKATIKSNQIHINTRIKSLKTAEIHCRLCGSHGFEWFSAAYCASGGLSALLDSFSLVWLALFKQNSVMIHIFSLTAFLYPGLPAAWPYGTLNKSSECDDGKRSILA